MSKFEKGIELSIFGDHLVVKERDIHKKEYVLQEFGNKEAEKIRKSFKEVHATVAHSLDPKDRFIKQNAWVDKKRREEKYGFIRSGTTYIDLRKITHAEENETSWTHSNVYIIGNDKPFSVGMQIEDLMKIIHEFEKGSK